MMLGLLLAFWATPDMTASHLFFAAVGTLYIAVGVRFEERGLRRELGRAYQEYTRRVPAVIPRPGETGRGTARTRAVRDKILGAAGQLAGACRDSTVGGGPAVPRVRLGHVFRRRQRTTEPTTRTPAATASGQRRCTAWLRFTRPDTSAVLPFTRPDTSVARLCALAVTSAALARALALTSALAASSSTVSPRRSRVRSISC